MVLLSPDAIGFVAQLKSKSPVQKASFHWSGRLLARLNCLFFQNFLIFVPYYLQGICLPVQHFLIPKTK